jgi:hypothetical protein
MQLLKGAPYEIPNAIREDLPKFFVEMGFKKGVEIGTAKGIYAEEFGKAGLELYCIDPWRSYDDYEYDENSPVSLRNQFEEAKQRLAPYNCHLIEKFSMDALKDFEDESLDFVYIDGNHGFKYVTEDIFEWSKKVKKGGIISGHDYITTNREFDNIHAKYVVDAYTKAFGIKNWFVLGRKEIGDWDNMKLESGVKVMINKQGERRNKHRSWMWFKV